jgi:hypothetical protein
MVTHFVDKTDQRIRLSMHKYLLLGEKSSYCPLVVDDYHVKKEFGNIWTTRWQHISGDPYSLDCLNIWSYLLYYIFAVVRLPGSREVHAAMSSVGMMVSLLDAILIIMRENGHFAQVAHPDIYIAAKKSDKNWHPVERVSDITLIAELLWQFWSKATSSFPLCTPATLSKIIELSCDIENLISRQDEHYNVFWLTLKGLVFDNRRCMEQVLVVDPPRTKEKKSFSKKLFSFGKDSVVSGKQIQEALPLRGGTNSLVRTGSETPWRRQKMQVAANNK